MLRSLLRTAAISALALGAALSPVQAQDLSDAQRQQFEAVVRDYILKHPEVIVESLETYQAREQAAEAERQKQALTTRKKELFEDPMAPVIGNPKGDVTVVEFFDYQCGYCKSVTSDVVRLTEQDANVKVVMKEFPILGPASVTAARAALAAQNQGKYAELHKAMMAHKGALDNETIFRLAKSVGLDVDQLKKDMDAPTIQKALQANVQLADSLGIRGTPGFVIGDELIPGAIRLDEMKRRITAVRSK